MISACVGFRYKAPLKPSKIHGVRGSISKIASPAATIAGIPIARAMIAVCEVGPPLAVIKPKIISGSRFAVSDGVKSSATSTDGSCAVITGSLSMCSNWRKTRCATSLRSTARAANTASSSLVICAIRLSITCCHAQAALCFCSIKTLVLLSSSSSCKNSACARKIAACFEPRRFFTS